MKQTKANREDLVEIVFKNDTSYNLWDRGYLLGEHDHLGENDIEVIKLIINQAKTPIKYDIFTLKPASYIHSEMMKKAIHVLRLSDLPESAQVPEGYFFIYEHPVVFDSHWYDMGRWKEIKDTQWRVKIDNDYLPHWKIYIYFPENHLFDCSPPFVVDYSIIPIREERTDEQQQD